MHEPHDLQPIGDDVVAAAHAVGLGFDIAGEAVELGLPTAAVAAKLIGLDLVELQAELAVVEGRFAFGDALALIDEEVVQGRRLLWPTLNRSRATSSRRASARRLSSAPNRPHRSAPKCAALDDQRRRRAVVPQGFVELGLRSPLRRARRTAGAEPFGGPARSKRP